MKLDNSLFRGEPVARMLVTVDKVENGEPCGDYLSIFMKKPKPFYGIITLIKGMDEYFDDMGYPQAYNAYRTFDDVQPVVTEKKKASLEPVSEELFSVRRGENATFLIQVLFRQNTDWQGIVTWLEGKKSQHFRSTLELIKLVDTALARSLQEKFGEW